MPTLDGYAQDKQPLRLLLTFTSSGVVPEQWYPTGTETAWTFPAGGSTEPLNQAQGRHHLLQGAEPRRGRRRRPRGLDRRRLDRQLLRQQRGPGPLGRPDHRQEHPQGDGLPVLPVRGHVLLRRRRGHHLQAQEQQPVHHPRRGGAEDRVAVRPLQGLRPAVRRRCPWVARATCPTRTWTGCGPRGAASSTRSRASSPTSTPRSAARTGSKISSHLDSVREIERRLDSGGPAHDRAPSRPAAGGHRPRPHRQLPDAHRHHEPSWWWRPWPRTAPASPRCSTRAASARSATPGSAPSDAHHTISHIEGAEGRPGQDPGLVRRALLRAVRHDEGGAGGRRARCWTTRWSPTRTSWRWAGPTASTRPPPGGSPARRDGQRAS